MARKKSTDDVRIPWLDGVRFHLGIVKRAEEDVFYVPVRLRNADRWSALAGFTLDSPAASDEVLSQVIAGAAGPDRLAALLDDAVAPAVGGGA